MNKEGNVDHAKQQIRVVKTPSGGAHLYVEDELLDTSNDLYASEGAAILVGVFGPDETHTKRARRTGGRYPSGAVNWSHEWTMKFVEHRVADRRTLRLI